MDVYLFILDSTAQYIGGEVGKPNKHGFVRSGLQCACVLIGVYNKYTGLPVAGIINQPFVSQDEQTGRFVYRKQIILTIISVKICMLSKEATNTNFIAFDPNGAQTHNPARSRRPHYH